MTLLLIVGFSALTGVSVAFISAADAHYRVKEASRKSYQMGFDAGELIGYHRNGGEIK